MKKHLVLVRMLSCRCQPHTSKTVPLGKTLNLSGAAYDLNVLAETRFGRSTLQKWPLPAQELTGARVTGSPGRRVTRAGARGRLGPLCAEHARGLVHASLKEDRD